MSYHSSPRTHLFRKQSLYGPGREEVPSFFLPLPFGQDAQKWPQKPVISPISLSPLPARMRFVKKLRRIRGGGAENYMGRKGEEGARLEPKKVSLGGLLLNTTLDDGDKKRKERSSADAVLVCELACHAHTIFPLDWTITILNWTREKGKERKNVGVSRKNNNAMTLTFTRVLFFFFRGHHQNSDPNVCFVSR